MPARRVKSLLKSGDTNKRGHREHRSKRRRRDVGKSYRYIINLFKRKKEKEKEEI